MEKSQMRTQTARKTTQEYYKSPFYYKQIPYSVMSTNEPPFIRIYQSCLILMNIKRKLFSTFNIKMPLNLQENQDKSTTSSKVYMCLKKVIKETKNIFQELSLNCKNQNHIEFIDNIIANLKSNSDYLTREEKMIIQAKQIIEQWNENMDPLVYYEQKEREDLKVLLKAKLLDIKTCAQACQETKQPLYIRQRERELKDKLHQIAEIQRRFNLTQYNLFEEIRKKMIRLLVKILQATNSRQKNTFIYDQRTLLFSKYIDFFQPTNKISEKQVIQYRKDLTTSVKNITQHFREQKESFYKLIQFMNSVEQQLKTFHKQYSKLQDQMTKQILDISPDINHIVSFQDILQIANNSKKFVNILFDWSQFNRQICNFGGILEEGVGIAEEYLKNIQKRAIGSKNIYIQQFIQDKKALETLSKKGENFQLSIFEVFKKLLQKIYRSNNDFERKNPEKYDSKRRKFEKSLLNIFQNYFKQTERKEEPKNSSQQKTNLSISQQNQFNKIQKFIENLYVFQRQENLDDCFQCSLGPRLLIHGRMKLLNEGILYVSNFNKKNLFFGKTKLFIAKQEILEINKQSALVIFPDVIEVITKKGAVYFHALGKRQRMFEQMNSYYFPEANINETVNQQTSFKEFKGDRTAYEARISSHRIPLQNELIEGIIPNLSLQNFFHRYFSDQEFIYQGENYKSFSYYSIKIAGGTQVQGTTYTPGIPYYFQTQKQNDQTQEDILESERFFTYKKEVPAIPFVSKGGYGICQEKNVCRWGGPYVFVLDIYTTLSGFSLTQGMLVKAKVIFQEKSNSVHYRLSAQVSFQTASAINGLLRGPVLSTLKGFMGDLYEKIKKVDRHKKTKKSSQKKNEGQQEKQLQLKIEQLKEQNVRLKKIIKFSIPSAIVLYLLTLIFFMLR